MTDTTTAPTDQATMQARRRAEAAVARRIIVVVALVLLAWGGAIALWGLPGLYLPALALVPVIWIVLLLISFG